MGSGLALGLASRLGAGAAWLLGAGAVAASACATAAEMPGLPAMQALMAAPAVTATVVEPHLTTREREVRVSYRGWPATAVLDKLLGAAWRAAGAEVEFRALDGYVSRIPNERFDSYGAWLVFERIGHPTFTLDNLQQNEKNVPLGPWYLVWDNITHPELLPEGAADWPYQITQVLVSRSRADALLPPGIGPGFEATAALTQKYCLSCHRVNGYGGDKAAGNLAQVAQAMPRVDFLRWVLEPGKVKPGTTMPGLPDAMPEAERRVLAQRLLDYLVAVPVVR